MSRANEQAFPVSHYSKMDGSFLQALNGLTKREYFAALAMQGICSGHGNYENGVRPSEISQLAVVLADALLAELERAQ